MFCYYQDDTMNNIPLVSIIIPFYNTPENFLRESIESVFAQGYKNWKLLLVDDGSTEECSEIAKYYSNDYPKKVTYLMLHRYWGLGRRIKRAQRFVWRRIGTYPVCVKK
jgi:glycosyltransferase involved in cell wall biosynthesis